MANPYRPWYVGTCHGMSFAARINSESISPEPDVVVGLGFRLELGTQCSDLRLDFGTLSAPSHSRVWPENPNFVIWTTEVHFGTPSLCR
jgi:hypothetical protein